jgi:exopolyphosphatase/guanosine-5'-triphosphate,3'-diphosphate pyrophosphatase
MGSLEPVLRRRALLNLGLSVGARGMIPPDRVAAALAATKRLRRQLDMAGADVVVALATAALRDAGNGAEIVQRLERAVGAPVRALGGEEEAYLCFVGQRASVWTGGATAVGIDLGGGSLELAVGDQDGVAFSTSVPVGATRLQGELRTGDPLTPRDVRAIRQRTAAALRPLRPALTVHSQGAMRVIVSGGTARALARLAAAGARRGSRSMEVNQVELPLPQVEELSRMLSRLSLAERLALPGISPRRAPVLPIGAVILAKAGAELGVERFVVSEWGLREGALLDVLARG